MTSLGYLQQANKIPIAYLPGSRGERIFEVTEDIQVTLSDGYDLLIPKGFKTDLRSVPGWLWTFIRPYNDTLLAYLIHDRLYADKLGQMGHFAKLDPEGLVKPYVAKQFADDEMYRWALSLAPHRKLESYVSYIAVRRFGNPVYWGRANVPV